jgi:hypothetical protein
VARARSSISAGAGGGEGAPGASAAPSGARAPGADGGGAAPRRCTDQKAPAPASSATTPPATSHPPPGRRGGGSPPVSAGTPTPPAGDWPTGNGARAGAELGRGEAAPASGLRQGLGRGGRVRAQGGHLAGGEPVQHDDLGLAVPQPLAGDGLS